MPAIMYNNTLYAGGGGGGGGTTVIANPTGTPTEILNTIQIGETIYSLPSGGENNPYERHSISRATRNIPNEVITIEKV